MKNFLKFTLCCVMLTLLVALTANAPASAEAKAIDIIEDTIKVDLDGNGKEETISTRTEYTVEEWIYSVDVSINGKKVFSEILENNECIFQASVYVSDINPKDGYKELVVDLADEFSSQQRVYRYKKKKLKLLFDTGSIGFLEGLVSKQKKDDNVLMYEQVTTPIGNCFYVTTNNKIQKYKLKEINPKNDIYTVIDQSWGGRDLTFILAKEADIYTKSNLKKVKTTLKKGTEFHVTKLKKVNGEFAYAYISLADGESNIGWLDLSQHSYEDELVTDTLFAG